MSEHFMRKLNEYKEHILHDPNIYTQLVIPQHRPCLGHSVEMPSSYTFLNEPDCKDEVYRFINKIISKETRVMVYTPHTIKLYKLVNSRHNSFTIKDVDRQYRIYINNNKLSSKRGRPITEKMFTRFLTPTMRYGSGLLYYHKIKEVPRKGRRFKSTIHGEDDVCLIVFPDRRVMYGRYYVFDRPSDVRYDDIISVSAYFQPIPQT